MIRQKTMRSEKETPSPKILSRLPQGCGLLGFEMKEYNMRYTNDLSQDRPKRR